MVYYGNPLEFIDAPYYSAIYQALEGQYREILTREIVTLIDAKNSVSYGTRPAAMEMARHLSDIYNGGKVMLVTGSPNKM
jgi:hypothetical protein